MGKAIQQSIDQTDDMVVSGMWARGSSLDEILAGSDVLIDFSLPSANAEVLQAVSKHQKPLVCGVSGLDSDQIALFIQTLQLAHVVLYTHRFF